MDACPSQVFRFSTRDPDEFAEKLTAGGVLGCSVSALGKRFVGEGVIGALPRLMFIFPRIDNSRVLHRNFEEFDGVTINISLAAPLRFRRGAKTREYTAGSAYLRGPGDEFDLTTQHGSSLMGLGFSPELVTWLEDRTGKPLALGDTLSLETPEGKSLHRYLNFIWDEIQNGGALLNSTLATLEIENSVAALFYAATQRSNQTTETGGALARPDYLMRAEEYIRANLSRPLSVLDVATAAGVSPGTLSRVFRRHRGVTTREFIEQHRLNAARENLLAAAPDSTTVTEVALKWGFTHMGRFAVNYRRTFGEKPSETLRR